MLGLCESRVVASPPPFVSSMMNVGQSFCEAKVGFHDLPLLYRGRDMVSFFTRVAYCCDKFDVMHVEDYE